MPIHHDGDRKTFVGDWGSHVDAMIREAQARGDFDNLPGAGKPIPLEENVFAGPMETAFRLAKNAGAAPLWVELDKEIAADTAALRAMLGRTAAYLQQHASALARRAGTEVRECDAVTLEPDRDPPPVPAAASRRKWRSLWSWLRIARSPAGASMVVSSGDGLRSRIEVEAERQRARGLYLRKAAELDEKIQEFNAQRPRNLSWLEKVRFLPHAAAREFDAQCPPFSDR
jgi:hypothetical protein